VVVDVGVLDVVDGDEENEMIVDQLEYFPYVDSHHDEKNLQLVLL
jgi:hypothetical protein